MDTKTRASILEEAKTWLNTPYHSKARIKGVGVDCGGYIYEIFRPYLPLPPFPKDYAEDWSLHKSDNEIYLDFIGQFVEAVQEPLPADLVMWQFGRNYGHGTLYIKNQTYIHAWGRTGVGSVRISNEAFFRIGMGGKPRPKMIFRVKPEFDRCFEC
jgi:cell wall-associated NlpC family hydrolase